VLEAVGPYRIIAKLGEGGMGEVYLAEDTDLHRRVAIKWLRDPSLSAPDALNRIRDEARAAARLTHPHIAAVYHLIDPPAGPAIVMEYVAGEPLTERLRRGPMAPSEVMAIGAQLADALAAAHERGVIHRDLKPANICIEGHAAKILDFGIARIRHTGTTVPASATTASGQPMMIGTPGYCAPEQWLSGIATARSDLFSLGVVLYEMCTGARPFGPAYADVTPRPAHDVNPAVPRAFGTLMSRLIARDPSARPASAREVQRDLQHLAERAPVSTPVTRPFSRAGAALLGIALVAAAGTPLVMRAGDRRLRTGRPVVAVLPFHAAESDAAVAAGFDQSLASDLSLVPGLVTIGRDAVSQYRGEHPPLDEIADAVGAEYLVDGDVRRDGGQWTLDVRLAGADRSDPVWRRQYSTGADGLLAVREQISDDLAAALGSDAGLPRPARRAPTDNVEAFNHYSQGVAFLDRRDIPGNVDRAIRLFQSSVDKDSRFALAHAGLAQAYWEKYAQLRDPEMPRLAERAILDAVTLDPEHPQVRFTAALIFSGTGRADRALEQLEALVAKHPHDAAFRLLGQILARRGDIEGGLRQIERALALRPGYWENHGAKGVVYLLGGRFDEAIAAFRRVTELQPDTAWGYQLLGATLQNAGRLDEALDSYEQALAVTPTAGTWSNIATIHYQAGRSEAAVAAFQRAVDLRPNDPVLRRNLGDALQRTGATRKARAEYEHALTLTERALEINPADARTTAVHALLEAKLGRVAAALQSAARAVEAAPRDPETHYRQGVVLTLAGRRREAIASLRRATDLGYSRALLAADDDLSSLARDAEFRKLAGIGEREEIR
jgi:serine/threonine-protein kinase